MQTIIIDANVGAKLFIQETDSQLAIELFEHCVTNSHNIVVPELFKYEIASIANRQNLPMGVVMSFFDAEVDTILNYIKPTIEDWQIAETIAQTGHLKSGYPSMYDSIYHAIAINLKGIFVTADLRHYKKTSAHGHIETLNNWQNIFVV